MDSLEVREPVISSEKSYHRYNRTFPERNNTILRLDGKDWNRPSHKGESRAPIDVADKSKKKFEKVKKVGVNCFQLTYLDNHRFSADEAESIFQMSKDLSHADFGYVFWCRRSRIHKHARG
ncbi:hypothetical protein AVEN_189533-1 [Araneus ventricosus]|uniref:Uncharacterized protein n=1 Tax=Araneus ventricosus TaxID=182803 RepID=A0A4Y2GP15_ARAVE|nr:hypothetical protein AVEN_189533-1 [Araneus ventricosus]